MVTTSAPVRREYDIPIVEPCVPPPVPRRLPEPDPSRLVPIVVVPIRQPVEVRCVLPY